MRLDIYHHFTDELELLRLVKTLDAKLEKFMSQVSDYQAKVEAHLAKGEAAVEGLKADVKFLTDQIAALQASAGQITPEDQAILDSLEARVGVLADKLGALDDLTTPPALQPDLLDVEPAEIRSPRPFRLRAGLRVLKATQPKRIAMIDAPARTSYGSNSHLAPTSAPPSDNREGTVAAEIRDLHDQLQALDDVTGKLRV